MKQSPEQRREVILEKLRESGRLSMEAIIQELGISTMTANRDVRQLEEEGRIRRERGGIALPAPLAKPETCMMCLRSVPERTRFLFTQPNGEISTACCPHCGLGHMTSLSPNVSVFASDFLYGTLVGAASASYVVGSQVRLCCAPSVLSFESHSDALRFKTGFGGEVMTLEQALEYFSPGKTRRAHHH